MSPVRPTVQVIGEWLNPDHYKLRDFLSRIAQPYEWLEAGSEGAQQLLAERGLSDPPLPVVIDGADTLTAVTIESLANTWSHLDPPKREHYDFAVIGAGPAGLA